MVPCGTATLPSRERSGLVRSTASSALSRTTLELSVIGRCPSIRRSSRDTYRVPRWYTPCSCRTSDEMAPARSKTAKVSWCISTRASSSCPSVTRVSAMRRSSRTPSGVAEAPGRGDRPLVDPDVIARHPRHGEPPLELSPARRPVERQDGGQHRHRLVHRADDRPGQSLPEHLLHRTPPEGEHRSSAGHCLDHHQAEGLGPVDGEEQRLGIREELDLVPVPELAQ